MKHKIAFISIIFSFLSCTKEIPLKTKNINPVLIVNSIICPDSIIKVQVSKSVPITSTESRVVNNAKVSLFENGNFVNTLVYDVNGIYTIGINPTIGKQYELKVEADGFKEVSASETLQNTTKIIEVSYTSNTGYSHIDQMPLSNINITFNDDISKKNYYEILFYCSSKYISKVFLSPYDIRLDNLILKNEGDKDYYPTSIFFSDELFNGKKCDFTIKVTGGTPDADCNLYAILRTTTYNYYKYRKSWTRHSYNQNQKIIDYIDFFRGEPIDMFTNVENGGGIFAGYTQDIKQATIIK